MKVTDTISVNPGKTTLGRVNEETLRKIARSSISESKQQSRLGADVLSIVFPGTKSGLEQFKNYALPLRAVFATLLIISGLSIAQGTGMALHSLGIGIAVMAAGACLAIGFICRPVMALSSIFFALAGAIQLRGGVTDLNAFSLMFGSLVFAATGSGKYSCDFLIAGFIKRSRRMSQLRKAKERMGYKAFQYATKTI